MRTSTSGSLRLREACAGGVVSLELADAYDELQNKLLAERVEFRGESMPLRSAQAQVALLDDYADARGARHASRATPPRSSTTTRLDLMRRGEELEAELTGEPDPVARSEELKGISSASSRAGSTSAAERQTSSWLALRERWLDRLLGDERDDEPPSPHVSYLRRMSPLAGTYTKERAVPGLASRRSRGSASTSRTSRASGSTSTTGRRRTRGPA